METHSLSCRQPRRYRVRGALIAVCFGVAALSLSAADANAQADAVARAKKYFAEAAAAYQAKEFKKAAQLYLKAFEEFPNPIFHYNVAESYKQLLDCPNTLHYYRRYLGASKKLPEDKRRLELEKRAQELIDLYAQRCKEGGPTTTPPVKPDPDPDKDKDKDKNKDKDKDKNKIKKPDGETDDPEDPPAGVSKGVFRPTKINSSVVLGPSFVSLGDGTPVLFSFGASLGYPVMTSGKMSVDLGGAFTLTSVPWEDAGLGVSGTALISSVLANVGATYDINPKLSLRGEFGLGLLIFSGLADGNPFIPANMRATGALSAFNVRVAAGASYALTNNITLTALPVVFAYSPAPAGLNEDISALSRFEMMFGLGYRM